MMSCAAFARHLERAAIRARNELDMPTEELMVEVAKEAKAAIGTYDFGWAPLTEATKDDRVKRGYPADEPLLRTGSLRDSIGHKAELIPGGARGIVFSEQQVAAWQECGTSKMPPRPFLSTAMIKAEPKASEIFGAFAVKILTFS